MRKTKEVLEDHLQLSKEGRVEEDLTLNFSKDVKLLTTYGTYEGHKGVQELAEILQKELPEATFKYKNFLVEGEVGFLEWSGFSKKNKVKDGADSYLVRDGLIIAQTIHYTISKV